MKSRRRRTPFGESADPAPFDYTLLSHLYVHEDGTDVIDMGGYSSRQAGRREVERLLKNKSFSMAPPVTATAESREPFEPGGALLCLQVDSDDEPEEVSRLPLPARPKGLVRIEDTVEHLWMVSQLSVDNAAPFARMFSSPENLFDYIGEHKMALPSRSQPAANMSSAEEPITKWIDIQMKPNSPGSLDMVSAILSKFPVHQNTIDSCKYLVVPDRIDTSHLSPRGDSYLSVILSCTPLIPITAAAGETEPLGGGDAGNTMSVMEMRFEAMERDLPRSSVPEPVAVAVIIFPDWIITVHEHPFAEMDDLLRMIQLQCGPTSRAPTAMAKPPQRLTSALVFTSLFQIAVGHHLDSVVLAEAVDDLGNIVFDGVTPNQQEQDDVLRRITAVRRCFSECAADVSRREQLVASLLQPHLAHNFLVRESKTREQLENAQAHLRYVQHELTDSRDTVAVANWYHNVALQWVLLRRGNRALRMLLLLTEVANIIYPIVMFQTLYSINVRVPFDSEGDPPSESLGPFFFMTGIILLYLLLCSRAVFRIFNKKRFQTKLLA